MAYDEYMDVEKTPDIYPLEFTTLITEMKPYLTPLPFNEEIKLEYMKFFILKHMFDDSEAPFILSPSGVIDSIWHEHIIRTKNYMEMCLKVFGKMYHHDPASANYKKKERYDRTLNKYKLIFKVDPPRDIWNPTEEMLMKEKEERERKKAHDIEVYEALEKYNKEKDDDDVKTIFIRTQAGNQKYFNFHLDAPVKYVKHVYEAFQGVPSDKVRFLWAGKELDDKRTLHDYGINDDSTIETLLRLVGC